MNAADEPWMDHVTNLRANAALLRAIANQAEMAAQRLHDNCELLASMMMRHGFAAGHGDTIADLIGELDAQLKEQAEKRAK